MLYYSDCGHFTTGVATLADVGTGIGIYTQRFGSESSFSFAHCDEEELHACKEFWVC